MKLNNKITVLAISILLISNCYAKEKNKIRTLKKGTCIIAEIDKTKSGHALKNIQAVKCPISKNYRKV